MWYKIKKMKLRKSGVEQQVRPPLPKQHYVFDFTTSIADRTLWSRLSFSQWTGIVRSTSWSGGNQYAYYNKSLDINWTKVKKITYKTNTWGNVSSWNGSILQYLSNKTWAISRPDSSYTSACATTSQFSTWGSRKWGCSYLDVGLVERSPTSTQNVEMVLDLSNKKATVTFNGTIVANQVSMDETKIQQMRNLNNQYLEMWLDATYYKYVSSIELLIEY